MSKKDRKKLNPSTVIKGDNEIESNINFVTTIYERNNSTLLKISKQNILSNKQTFDIFLKKIIEKNPKTPYNDLSKLPELMNIDWIFLNSIYLSLFTNFENLISKLASIVEDKTQSEKKIQNIKGHGYIDRYRKYMELVGNLNSAKKNKNWNEIDSFKLVRNKITHNGGYLITNPQSTLANHPKFNFLIENKVLLAGSLGHIRIRETFFLEKLASLTSKLSRELREDIDKM